MDLKKIKRYLPLGKMEELAGQNPRYSNDLYSHTGKYVKKIDLYLQEKIDVARALKLDVVEDRSILDIGTGVGMFPWLCRQLGHVCLSTYYDDFEFYEKMWELLEIKRPTYLEVRANRHWQLGYTKRFDIITAQRTVFDRYPANWSAYNWIMFLEEAYRHLKDEGILFVKTNCLDDTDTAMDLHAKRLLEPFLLTGFNSTTFLITKSEIENLIGAAR